MTKEEHMIYRYEHCKFPIWESAPYHHWIIKGRPLSGNTKYVCVSCGREVFRG